MLGHVCTLLGRVMSNKNLFKVSQDRFDFGAWCIIAIESNLLGM